MRIIPLRFGHTASKALRLACLVLTLTGPGAVSLALAEQGANEAVRNFDVPAGALPRALTIMAAQAGIALSFDPSPLNKLNTSGLRGEYSVADGFARLLAGTGYELVALSSGDYSVQSKDSASDGEGPTQMNAVVVYGEIGEIDTATKLNLSVFETPQVVSVISRDEINDFSLREVNTVLTYAPGVTVEEVETGRTYYTARGFDIINFQYDGVGTLLAYGLNRGHADSAIYERVEVVKGATGLITGLANPSATVNFVRKRPTDEHRASISGGAGSWNRYRVEADLSGPIVGDKLKGRLVLAKDDGDTYMDRHTQDVNVFYGIINADITDRTRFSLGHSINKNDNDGNSSGALPLFYNDGSVTDYDPSTNTAPDWAYQDIIQTRTFVELEHDVADNWVLKAVYTHEVEDKAWESFYLSGSPEPVTEEGLLAHASYYESEDTFDIFDLSVSGSFSLWGRRHEMVAGFNFVDLDLTGFSIYSSAWQYDPVGGDWALGTTPRPPMDSYDPTNQSFDIDQKQKSFYISSRLNATDKLSILLGARAVDVEQDGINYGAPQGASDQDTVPYLGMTYEIVEGTMLYASYSEVFTPQAWVNASLEPLGSVTGKSAEAGIKQEIFDGSAILSLTAFQSSQDNFGEWVARDTTTGLNIYRGIEFDSQGAEIELAGEVLDGLNISAGYTYVTVEDENGDDTRRYIPTQQLKVATSYQLPVVPGLRLGASLRWQNEIYYNDVEVQGSYALVDLFARYDLNPNLSLAVNINNVTDEKYRLSVQWGQANYGAPLNVFGTVNWRF